MSFSAIAWAQSLDLGPRSASRSELLRELADMRNWQTGTLNPRIATLARKTGRSERCVQYGLRWLERVGLVTQLPQAGRHACHYVLHIGRSPSFPEPPNLHPEAASFAPQAGPNLHPEPSEDNQEGEPRESACASAPATPASIPDEIFVQPAEASEQAADNKAVASPPAPPPPARSARKTIPDGFELAPEVRQQAIEAGYDPEEIAEEIADWASDRGHRSADWSAFARRWIRREGKFRQSARPARVDHGARASELLARVRANFAAGLMA